MSDPTATDTGATEPHPDAIAASEAIAPDAPPEPVVDEPVDAPSYEEFAASDPALAEPEPGDGFPDFDPLAVEDEPLTEALDAGGAGDPYVGVDPIYHNAASATERPLATPADAVSEGEALSVTITEDRAKRDRHTGKVTGFTRD